MLMRNYYAKRKKVQELIDDSLLRVGDFNVRVTVVDKGKLTSEDAWKEVFRDSIGGGIIHDTVNHYVIKIMTGSGIKIRTIDIGSQILENNFNSIKDEDIVRISLARIPAENKSPKLKTWIVIRL